MRWRYLGREEIERRKKEGRERERELTEKAEERERERHFALE